MLKTAWLIFKTELILRLREPNAWLYPVAFFLIVISFFPIAFTPNASFLEKYLPPYIWITALLASFIAIEELFHADLEDGHLEQLLLSQTMLSLNVFSKLSAQWIMTELPLVMLSFILCLFFGLSWGTTITLSLGLLVGTPILTLLGGLVVALALGLRQQGTFLGLLLLPLVMPILMIGILLVQEYQAGLSVAGLFAFLSALTIFAITLIPPVIAIALRMSVEY